MNTSFVSTSERTGHNPYFNRWFSAIYNGHYYECTILSHNPYLIDGFLQSRPIKKDRHLQRVTILILIDGFLQ